MLEKLNSRVLVLDIRPLTDYETDTGTLRKSVCVCVMFTAQHAVECGGP